VKLVHLVGFITKKQAARYELSHMSRPCTAF